MSDHIESIKRGFLVLLPVLDDKGRAIIYAEPALAEGELDKVCDFVCVCGSMHSFGRLINLVGI